MKRITMNQSIFIFMVLIFSLVPSKAEVRKIHPANSSSGEAEMSFPLIASTFFGGKGGDMANCIAVSDGGDVYVAGFTTSPAFSTTPGAYDETFNGGRDVFVCKFDKDLKTLLASTFIGGSGNETCSAIALDGKGHIYLAGWTSSSGFPTTPGVYDEKFNGGNTDVFILKLSTSLSTLTASTFLGGSGGDLTRVNRLSIEAGEGGAVVVVGITASFDFPTSADAYDKTFNGGGSDAFVSKLSVDLTALTASTFLGGSGEERCGSIVVNPKGDIYVTGTTASSDFPSTPGAYDRHFNGKEDAFVSKLTHNLTTLTASTFLGGRGADKADCMTLDEKGNVYVGGCAARGFPVTSAAYDNNHFGGAEAYVSRLDEDLTTLSASTFLSGKGRGIPIISDIASLFGGNKWKSAQCTGIICDGKGNIYTASYTRCRDLKTTPRAYGRTHNGGVDIFLASLDTDLTTVHASTYLGGEGDEETGSALACEGKDSIFLAGVTSSLNFPLSLAAYDKSYNGGGDVFVLRIKN